MSLFGAEGLAEQVPSLATQDEWNGSEFRITEILPIDIERPVNNFLKSPAQIEKDFRREQRQHTRRSGRARVGKIIPIDEALKGNMEENY